MRNCFIISFFVVFCLPSSVFSQSAWKCIPKIKTGQLVELYHRPCLKNVLGSCVSRSGVEPMGLFVEPGMILPLKLSCGGCFCEVKILFLDNSDIERDFSALFRIDALTGCAEYEKPRQCNYSQLIERRNGAP